MFNALLFPKVAKLSELWCPKTDWRETANKWLSFEPTVPYGSPEDPSWRMSG